MPKSQLSIRANKKLAHLTLSSRKHTKYIYSTKPLLAVHSSNISIVIVRDEFNTHNVIFIINVIKPNIIFIVRNDLN